MSFVEPLTRSISSFVNAYRSRRNGADDEDNDRQGVFHFRQDGVPAQASSEEPVVNSSKHLEIGSFMEWYCGLQARLVPVQSHSCRAKSRLF
jgi:hypothetical protein